MQKKIEDNFLITTQQFFDDMQREKIEIQHFNSALQFPILLPFHIHIPSGLYLTFNNDDSIISFNFSTKEINEEINIGELENEPTFVKKKLTRVEMFYIYNGTEDINLDILSNGFNILLACLNKLFFCYLKTTEDFEIFEVKLQDLPYACFFKLIDIQNLKEKHNGLFFLHHKVPYDKPVISANTLQDVAHLYYLLETNKNPFILLSDNYLTAKREFENKNYRNTIIFIQLYIETLLKTIFINLLIEEGLTENDAETVLAEIPFLSLIKKYLHQKLGGKWNITENSSVVGNWYNNTYVIRNKIIHRGYKPNQQEAENAFKSSQAFITYTIELIKKKKNIYPIINKYFL